ncbi:MAG: hypothetical protein K2Y31_04630 [Burkholderiales bacterium]|jgi:hypothetical protein|nr:hypothetical protein [Burkholderiales bacterium]
MQGWQLCAGATLLMPSGNQGNHLHVALNDPCPFENYGSHASVILVNLSSIRDGLPYDTTCVLAAGAHPFIKRDSFVFYRNARIEQASHVVKLVERGVFSAHQPVSAEVLQVVKAGLYQSPFTKREFKQFRF